MSAGTTAISNRTNSRAEPRRRDLLELWIGYALILVVIWTPRPWQRNIYFVAATFIIATTLLAFPGLKAMGLRPTNFTRSFWLVGAALAVTAVAVVVAGRMGTLHA